MALRNNLKGLKKDEDKDPSDLGAPVTIGGSIAAAASSATSAPLKRVSVAY